MLRSVISRSSPSSLSRHLPRPGHLHLPVSHPTPYRPNSLRLVLNPERVTSPAVSSGDPDDPGPSSLPLGHNPSRTNHLRYLAGNGILLGLQPLLPISRSTPTYPHLLTRAFHATPRNQLSPIHLLAGLLKTSTALETARMAARVGLTFVPIILLKNMKSKMKLRDAEKWGHPDFEQKKEDTLRKIRNRTILFHILIFIPLILYWATIIASLERTPLTGRWRVILLSPEEEEEIAAQLAGPGWYRAVGEILSTEGAPSIIPPSDWRLVWVRDTLRRLERAIPTLQQEKELCPHWVDCGPDDIPLPPPAEYPLRPRPRASEYLRRFAEMSCARTVAPAPHAIAGPPYSLLLVDRPNSSNAFSYGFGPDGGGGIVVFSGFLDEVLAKCPAYPPPPQQSFLSRLFGLGPPRPVHPIPTDEQTAELATLLAHELAHLVLSHHIETLSSAAIVWPSVLSIVTDSIRAFLFPITMLFGPFINDALAGMWKAGAGEFSQLQEYCTSQKQEVEADVVSVRLLAHAGFDPRQAVRFWEGRKDTPQTAECSPARAEAQVAHESSSSSSSSAATAMARRLIGETHPVHEIRVQKLRSELERWEMMRSVARDAKERARLEAAAAATVATVAGPAAVDASNAATNATVTGTASA